MKGQLTDAERLVQSIQNQNFPQIDKNSGKVGDQLVRFGLEKDVTQKELDTEMAFVRTQAQLQLESAQESASRYGEKSQQLSDLAVEVLFCLLLFYITL
jgi:Ser/Thr protein kinase RdoA (MazF antagonist)